jgi:hypothetical protein
MILHASIAIKHLWTWSFLTCYGENVSKKHIDDDLLLQTENVSCMFCDKPLPSQEFHINKVLKNLIGCELHE